MFFIFLSRTKCHFYHQKQVKIENCKDMYQTVNNWRGGGKESTNVTKIWLERLDLFCFAPLHENGAE